MTHILAISDWRSQPIDDLYTILETVEPTPDLLLYAGDDLSRFKSADTNTDHLAELARLTKHQQSLYVRGNDDIPPSTGPQFDTEFTTDLHKTPHAHENLVSIGQEGSTQGPGLITYTEDEVQRHLSEQRVACECLKQFNTACVTWRGDDSVPDPFFGDEISLSQIVESV